ncbi:DUF3054 domain-containing protein [Arthrobacter crusticola]|uniref:DUF3054 domain-containing protein n=1 Tax=Arthrobacter crusticola TaxID=2547960 RepID=A0A4R5U2T0_9MICC|nr:DUF3054 domain-containing protein [Arthrobacter crusticola]TDK27937.1 DUF3054 domain-containing protein [Arthrobacter crusticola]
MASQHPTPRPTQGLWPWLAVDVAAIILFAVSGRSTHEHGLSAAGIAATAAPFVVACVAGWLGLRAWRTPRRLWPTGVGIWITTAAGGLLLRFLTGGGVALSFQVVTLVVLGSLLLLPRLLVSAAVRGRGRARSGRGNQAVR